MLKLNIWANSWILDKGLCCKINSKIIFQLVKADIISPFSAQVFPENKKNAMKGWKKQQQWVSVDNVKNIEWLFCQNVLHISSNEKFASRGRFHKWFCTLRQSFAPYTQFCTIFVWC